MSALLWALVAVPLAAGTLLGVTGRRWNRQAPALGVAAAVVTLVLAVAAALLRPAASTPLLAGIEAGLRVDGLSAVMVVTVAAVTVAVLVFAAGEFGTEANRGRFFGLMLLFAGGMLVTVTATTLPPLLMAWEAMGATSWALIGYRWHEPERARAADVAFLTTRTADLGLYLAAGAALAGGVGSLRLDALPTAASPWLQVVAAGVVVAALGKSAQLPFSFWLSRAMEGPGPVSALLHSAAMVAAGAYLLLRLAPLQAATGWAGPLVAWIGVGTALLLGLVAVAQTDLKQLLAASTAAQVGFMVLGAGCAAVAAATTQFVAHAATKAGLFLAASAWLSALGTKRLPALRGAARSHRVVGAAFTAGALALAGVPPLSLWAAKDEVLAAAGEHGWGLHLAGFAAAVVSALYSVKALWYVWRPLPRDAAAGYDSEQRGTRRVTPLMRAPLLVLALAAATLGVLALPGPAGWLRAAVGGAGEPSPQPWEVALSAGTALAVAAFAWWRGPRPLPAIGWAAGWLGLERAARKLIVRPVMALARFLADFDERVIDATVQRLARATLSVARLSAGFDDRRIDGAVQGVARASLAAARWSARADDGGIDAVVGTVAAGVRRLGRWARRPQTGLLHQYYAQAVIGLAALLLLVLLMG
ncbi:proton-conducting transporter membrane subunit [Nonomuraea sp. NPDC049504]|uniref:proton-conducting transporter transmembrane domain-containing protein n=1 Tax=Nonomuraea sp. NPDC049504 TaxID=3154729 RepID=UPI003441A2BB